MDPFLKIAYAQSKPLQKVAFFPSDDHAWLEKFKDTPLLEQAIALEQSDIQNEIAEKQQSMQTSEQQRSFWNNRDQIQLQKRMLELQLVQTQAAGGAPPMTEPLTGPDSAAMTGGVGGDSPVTPETSMKTSSAKTADYAPWVYGAVPGALGGAVIGAVPGGYMSHRGGEQARAAGESVTSGAKRSAIGQMVGGAGGFIAGEGIGHLMKMDNPHALALMGGLGGAVLGHNEAMKKYKKKDEAPPDEEKLSSAEYSFLCADAIGREMAKMAFGMNELKGLGGAAVDWAKKNPTKALSAAGGAGGAAYGAATAQGQNGQGPTMGQRLGRAAGFGALGAGAGAVAGQGVHVGKRMAGGSTFGQALGGHLETSVSDAVGAARNRASNPQVFSGGARGTVDDAHALIDRHMPTVNRLQEGIGAHITNNPHLQFGAPNLRATAGNVVDQARLAQIDSG
jgi:hypothetical protein